MKKYITPVTLFLVMGLPTAVFGATGQEFSGIERMITRSGSLIRQLVLVVAGIALLVFFWGLAKFILKIGGDAKAATEGKQLMIWGIVALFVMVSVWGLVYFLQDQFLPNGTFDAPSGLYGSGGVRI